MQLTVHNAEIHTATVEVKTLTISGKQVTLAVFRQLRPCNNLISLKTGTIQAEPWGWVNYFWGGFEDDGRHIHVVAQFSDGLARCYVPLQCPNADLTYDHTITREMNDHIRAERLQRRRAILDEYARSIARLRSLPQLFIAV